jgi:hypothetical protein
MPVRRGWCQTSDGRAGQLVPDARRAAVVGGVRRQRTRGAVKTALRLVFAPLLAERRLARRVHEDDLAAFELELLDLVAG